MKFPKELFVYKYNKKKAMFFFYYRIIQYNKPL